MVAWSVNVSCVRGDPISPHEAPTLPERSLVVVRTNNLASLGVDQVYPRTRNAPYGHVGFVTLGGFVGGPSLHLLAGRGASVEVGGHVLPSARARCVAAADQCPLYPPEAVIPLHPAT